MLEYIFFNKKTCDLFVKSATSSEIKTIVDCAGDIITVRLPEDSDEIVLEKLEDYYDELMDIERTLAQQQDGSSRDIHAAGITVQLKDGRNVYARVSPELLSKVMQSISTDELNTLVCAITEAVEDPDESSLCQ
ncbi:MAG: hypothetical protein KJN89_12495 [Gammaproteobacteria bacterium]|nr:hypothetical protein [Gammaproteobacteria bacterium]NNJ51185.1 hypothetical protein [Gammaproteobacteria bacterium]